MPRIMKVVHYATDKNFKLKPIEIGEFIKNNLPVKPRGGLWASPIHTKFGWKEWCNSEDFGDVSAKYPVVLDIDMSRIMVIKKASDLDKLPWCKLEGLDLLEFIDFGKLIKDGVDGIYLTEKGQWETRFTFPRGLYGWDCESVLVLNERCIRNYEQQTRRASIK